jgi:3-dehydroquinate dehydratase-1
MKPFFGYDMEPGLIPLVVGVVSTPEGLIKTAAADSWPCDVVEIRLDLIGDEAEFCDWPVAALRLTKAGIGTLLTVRSAAEGGRWRADEASRLDLLIQGIPHVTGIDLELDAPILADVVAAAQERVTVIGSRHHFRSMPEAGSLRATLSAGARAGVDVVKIAAYAAEARELARLTALFDEELPAPLCALAMGPLGPASRTSLPLAGSCLTYGYLDKPNAPGQPSAAEVRDALIEAHEAYRIFADAVT